MNRFIGTINLLEKYTNAVNPNKNVYLSCGTGFGRRDSHLYCMNGDYLGQNETKPRKE